MAPHYSCWRLTHYSGNFKRIFKILRKKPHSITFRRGWQAKKIIHTKTEMYFRNNINAHFKQKLRTLKLFQNLLIIAGHKENPSAHNCNKSDSRLASKGEEQKNLRAAFLSRSHTYYWHRHKRCVSDHLVQPVKSLYLCKYLFRINAAATFKDFYYLYCLSFSARALTVPDLGPVGLQNAGVGGKGYERGKETRNNLKTNKQEQNLQPWKSGEVQFNVNS